MISTYVFFHILLIIFHILPSDLNYTFSLLSFTCTIKSNLSCLAIGFERFVIEVVFVGSVSPHQLRPRDSVQVAIV